MDCVANITHARKNKTKQKTAKKVNIKGGGGLVRDSFIC